MAELPTPGDQVVHKGGNLQAWSVGQGAHHNDILTRLLLMPCQMLIEQVPMKNNILG